MADGCGSPLSAPTSCVCPWPLCCLLCTTGSSGSLRGRLQAPPTPCPALRPLRVLEQHRPPRLRPHPACLGPPVGHDRSQDCHGAAATAAAQLREQRGRPPAERLDSLARPHRGLRLCVHHRASPARRRLSPCCGPDPARPYSTLLLPGTQSSSAINSSLSWLTWSVVVGLARWSFLAPWPRGLKGFPLSLLTCNFWVGMGRSGLPVFGAIEGQIL